MGKIFKLFAQTALTSITNGVNKLQTTLNEFDVDDAKQTLVTSATKIQEKGTNLLCSAKNYMRKFEFNVNLQNESDEITTSFDGNNFIVNVKSQDGAYVNSTVITLPEDVDKTCFRRKFDQETQVVTFSFNKNFVVCKS